MCFFFCRPNLYWYIKMFQANILTWCLDRKRSAACTEEKYAVPTRHDTAIVYSLIGRYQQNMTADYTNINNRLQSIAKLKKVLLIISVSECILGSMCIGLENYATTLRHYVSPSPFEGPGVWCGLLLVITGMIGTLHALQNSVLMNVFRLLSSVIFTSITTVVYLAFLCLSIYHEYVWSNVQILIFLLIGSGGVINLVHMFYSSRALYIRKGYDIG